jgi:hypothetical protein
LPVDDEILLAAAGPFDIGEGDLAVDPLLDRVEDRLGGDRREITLSLQLQFLEIH